MCGRYAAPDREAVERYYGIERRSEAGEDFGRHYDVRPWQGNNVWHVPVVRHDADNKLELARTQWWLLPFWSKSPKNKFSTFNARVETVANASSFREPLKMRRCLFPITGWYEWNGPKDKRQRWFMQSTSGELLSLAGIWDRWEGKGGPIESCSIIVGPPNKALDAIHDRAPLIIPESRFGKWLDRELTDPDQVMDLLKPIPENAVKATAVERDYADMKPQVEALLAA